jgi:hypothetical protein
VINFIALKVNNVLSKFDLMLLTPKELSTVVQHEIIHYEFVKMSEINKDKPKTLFNVAQKKDLN